MGMWKRGAVAVAAGAALAVAGCATGKSDQKVSTGPEVKGEWLARVPPEQLGGVEEARSSLRAQEDEVTRAEVARKDAEARVGVARAELDAAKARVDAAEQAVKAARQRGQYGEIVEARNELETGKLARQAAEAKVTREERRVEAARARADVERARSQMRETEVNRAEYRALVAAGDVRAQEIDPAKYEEAMQQAAQREQQAAQRVTRAEEQLAQATQRYDELSRQLEAARVGPRPAG